MKKSVPIILLTLCLGGMIFCACDRAVLPQGQEDEPPTSLVHLHTFGDWEETPATCLEGGKRVRTCSECNETQEVPLDPLGHDWEETEKEPTCTEAGEVLKHCRCCGKDETEILPAPGHDFKESVEKESTCTQSGTLLKTCEVCGEEEREEIPEIPHTWGEIETVEEATCTKDGIRSAVCATCGKRENEQTIPALGHDWKTTGRDEPTCTDAGTLYKQCDRCKEIATESIPALGHHYSSEFTIDKDPTVDEYGSMSRHCTNPNCNSAIEVTPIDPLKDETEYTVHLRTTTGGTFPATSPVYISFHDEGGAETGGSCGLNVTKTLPTATYKVRVSNLPFGYSLAREEYTISPASPTLEIKVPASLHPDKGIHDTKYYNVGDVMYDIDLDTLGITAAEDGKTSLGELLSQYKAVLINFFFTTCSACVSEMPNFVAAYKAIAPSGKMYGEEVACLMICVRDGSDVARKFKAQTNYFMKGYPAEYNIPMLVMTNGWLARYFCGLNSHVGMVTAYPTTVLVDCEGVIVKSYVGGMSKQGFINLMSEGISRYETIHAWRVSEGLEAPPAEEESTAAAREAALLPEKRRVR